MNIGKKISAIYCFVLGFLLSGCYTHKVAERQSLKAKVHYPLMVAGLYEAWFPIKEKIRDSIRYLPGKEKYVAGPTRYVDCDSIVSSNIQKGHPEESKRTACPPCADTVRLVDTIDHYREVIRENTASIEKWRLKEEWYITQIQKATLSEAIQKNRAASNWRMFLWAAGIATIFIAWKIINWVTVFKL
jgi:hypothetical protein